MEKQMHESLNPGSFNQFTENNQFASKEAALGAYSLQLHQYRIALAEFYGIGIEDLRDVQA